MIFPNLFLHYAKGRSSTAAGKQNFTYFKDEAVDFPELFLHDATAYKRSEHHGPIRRNLSNRAVQPASAEMDSFHIVLLGNQFWPLKCPSHVLYLVVQLGKKAPLALAIVDMDPYSIDSCTVSSLLIHLYTPAIRARHRRRIIAMEPPNINSSITFYRLDIASRG